MEIDRYDEGVPSWVDHASPDPAAAAAFYSALFGWEAPEGPPEAGGYRLCTLRGRLVAGIGPNMTPGPPAWTTYVDVADADAAAERAGAHGGRVLFGPSDVMDAGRMGVLADPAGAVISIWQPRNHPGAGLVNEPGAFTWNELMTTDLAGAIAFYPAVFGWSPLTHGNEAGVGAYTEWQLHGRSVAGMMEKPASVPAEVPPFWGVYFAVDNVDRCEARVAELGGRTLMAPLDSPQGRFAALADPEGAAFSVIALASVPAPEGAAGSS